MTVSNHKQEFKKIEEKFAKDQGLPFQNVLPTKEIYEAMQESHMKYRHRVLPPFIVIWAFLSQVINGSSCEKAAKNVVAFFRSIRKRINLTDSAYCQARQKLPEEFLSLLAHKVSRKQAESVPPESLWCGRRVKIVDGSSLNMLDTPANQAAYPQSPSQKPGCGFPIARLVAIFCLTTGLILEMYMDPMSSSERRLFLQHYRDLVRGDVVLTDRGFCSYVEVAMLQMSGIESVMRMNASRKYNFRDGRVIGINDHITTWTKPVTRSPLLTQRQFNLLPDTLELREVHYRVAISGFRTQEVILVTTLLDSQHYSKEDLASLYNHRWQAELYLRDIKITMKMEFINSMTPEMVRNQVWVHVLAYNLIRRVMWESAQQYHVQPLRISLKGCIDAIEIYRPRLAANTVMLPTLYQDFLFAIAIHLIPDRPHRYEPRLLKRRRKPKYSYITKHRSEYREALGL